MRFVKRMIVRYLCGDHGDAEMAMVRKTIGMIAVFGAGTVLGPLLLAAISALDDETQGRIPPDDDQATRLIDAYQANLPSGLLFTTIYREPHVKNCGYDESEIFPDWLNEMRDARANGRFSLYEGYEAIDRWARELQDMEFLAPVTQVIREEHSPFELEFLRQCIESTVLSGLCMKHVAKFGSRVDRFPEKPRDYWYYAGSGYEEEVICTYLDGVAVRRGIAPPKRD